MLDKLGMAHMEPGHPLKEELGQSNLRRRLISLDKEQREAESPEFISPHSTTDTMDTDEAQEVNRIIKERMDREQQEKDYSNVPTQQKYQNVVDVGPTFPTVRELQEKAQETYEEISELEDSGVISFPKLEKEKGAHKKETQGKRVPIETGSLMSQCHPGDWS